MEFISAYKVVSEQLDHERKNICHQIEAIALQGKLDALKKVKYEEDIVKLNQNKDLCVYPNLNGEFQVRQMFENVMGKSKYSFEPSYEKKLVQKLITDFLDDPEILKATKAMQQTTLSTAIMENTFVDFDNENFLHK
jgi:hypothetical protein